MLLLVGPVKGARHNPTATGRTCQRRSTEGVPGRPQGCTGTKTGPGRYKNLRKPINRTVASIFVMQTVQGRTSLPLLVNGTRHNSPGRAAPSRKKSSDSSNSDQIHPKNDGKISSAEFALGRKRRRENYLMDRPFSDSGLRIAVETPDSVLFG